MSLPLELQVKELLEKSSSVLILLPREQNGDAFGAAAGLGAFFEKIGKSVTLSGEDAGDSSKRFAFLHPPKTVVPTISGVREFILSFNTKRNDIVSVRSERTDDAYNIFITPEKGSIDPRDFSFIPAKFSFDLVIVTGAPDKESLGLIASENPDIFYEVPVITLDCRAESERFGQVNIVDVTASTTSEVVTKLLEKIGGPHFDARVAGLLLGGIVSGTESFQKETTTPGALHAASQLMDRGADQHDIIFRLVKTQPLSLLKLWGRAMANLRWDDAKKTMWAQISQKDVAETGSRPTDIPLILEKIKSHSSLGNTVIIFSTSSDSPVVVTIKSTDSVLETLSTTFPNTLRRGDVLAIPLEITSFSDAEALILKEIPTESSAK